MKRGRGGADGGDVTRAPTNGLGDDPLATGETGPGSAVACRVEAYDDGAECTLYPTDADGAALVTTWMTAGERLFVDPEAMR